MLGEAGDPGPVLDLGSQVKLRSLSDKCFAGASQFNDQFGVVIARDEVSSLLSVALVGGGNLTRLSLLFVSSLSEDEVSEEICALAAIMLGCNLKPKSPRRS